MEIVRICPTQIKIYIYREGAAPSPKGVTMEETVKLSVKDSFGCTVSVFSVILPLVQYRKSWIHTLCDNIRSPRPFNNYLFLPSELRTFSQNSQGD